jgi:hypothetical protein
MQRVSKDPIYPQAWSNFIDAFQNNIKEVHRGVEQARELRNHLKKKTAHLLNIIGKKEINIKIPLEISTNLVKKVQETINKIREQQKELVNKLNQHAEDFEHAEINEDLFVILVFGAVNAGKSALANHVAGLDFISPPENIVGKCFVTGKGGEHEVERLEEKPVESTKDEQGLRLPGILWIDCPGVLSTTFKNSELAKRLIARADFFLFVSQSDAPFTQSEMKELYDLVVLSGNENADGCLIISKADQFVEDADIKTGKIIRRVIRKSNQALDEQAQWCNEQLKKAGLASILNMHKPIYISVYVAREALGRNWETGEFFRVPDNNYPQIYQESGMEELFDFLAEIVRNNGAEIKAKWPNKRKKAIEHIIQQTTSSSLAELSKVISIVKEQRVLLRNTRKETVDYASEEASSAVASCLKRYNVQSFNKFNKEKAQKELNSILKKAIHNSLIKFTSVTLKNADQKIVDAINEYVRSTTFDIDLKQIFKTKKYKSHAKGRGWGKAAGGAGGFLTGAAIGSFLGPVGGFIGGLVGGVLGSFGGGKAGEAFLEETKTVKISAGTNSNEVISNTTENMKNLAIQHTNNIFDLLDTELFGALINALERIEQQISKWNEELNLE